MANDLMKERLIEMRVYYTQMIEDINTKYAFTQDKDKFRIDYKKRSSRHIELQSVLEDFIADINKLLTILTF